mgnify:CR=1 FL=1
MSNTNSENQFWIAAPDKNKFRKAYIGPKHPRESKFWLQERIKLLTTIPNITLWYNLIIFLIVYSFLIYLFSRTLSNIIFAVFDFSIPAVDSIIIINSCNCLGLKPTFKEIFKCPWSIGSKPPKDVMTEIVINSRCEKLRTSRSKISANKWSHSRNP